MGEHGLLVVCADTASVTAAYADLRARADELGAVEIVPAARSVLLDGLNDPGATAALLAGWVPAAARRAATEREVLIPTRYDGPDLDEVAEQWELSAAEVVSLHQSCEFVVVFCGFAPGFAYCTGLPHDRVVRRRSEPRVTVPRGSVALAGEYTSIYPAATPGGWQLIGSTDLELWSPGSSDPALLLPGTRVRFVDG